MHVID